MLESRVREHLGNARRVLIAGWRGGYDVLGAIPLVHQLRSRGVEVELANLSFSYLSGLDARQDVEHPNLYAVDASAATERAYCPEAWLARWLDHEYEGACHVVWTFEKTGVRPLLRAYRSSSGSRLTRSSSSTAASTPCCVATRPRSAHRPRI